MSFMRRIQQLTAISLRCLKEAEESPEPMNVMIRVGRKRWQWSLFSVSKRSNQPIISDDIDNLAYEIYDDNNVHLFMR